MNFFGMRKPREFRHVPIYTDEHKDRVRQIKERAEHEVKGVEPKSGRCGGLHGDFADATYHLRRRREGRGAVGWRVNLGVVVVLVIMFLVIIFLLKR